MKRKQTMFEDQDNIHDDTFKVKYHCQNIWTNFLNILKGNENFMVRSANILHVLGSLTVGII